MFISNSQHSRRWEVCDPKGHLFQLLPCTNTALPSLPQQSSRLLLRNANRRKPGQEQLFPRGCCATGKQTYLVTLQKTATWRNKLAALFYTLSESLRLTYSSSDTWKFGSKYWILDEALEAIHVQTLEGVWYTSPTNGPSMFRYDLS